jgi:hypothetical protein
MTYRVSIVDNDATNPGEYISTYWWKNFQNYTAVQESTWKTELVKFNGQDYPNDTNIVFDTEEDFVVFKLKFG